MLLRQTCYVEHVILQNAVKDVYMLDFAALANKQRYIMVLIFIRCLVTFFNKDMLFKKLAAIEFPVILDGQFSSVVGL
jgi:hypothetical protein